MTELFYRLLKAVGVNFITDDVEAVTVSLSVVVGQRKMLFMPEILYTDD
jgi:hypothetical protein